MPRFCAGLCAAPSKSGFRQFVLFLLSISGRKNYFDVIRRKPQLVMRKMPRMNFRIAPPLLASLLAFSAAATDLQPAFGDTATERSPRLCVPPVSDLEGQLKPLDLFAIELDHMQTVPKSLWSVATPTNRAGWMTIDSEQLSNLDERMLAGSARFVTPCYSDRLGGIAWPTKCGFICFEPGTSRELMQLVIAHSPLPVTATTFYEHIPGLTLVEFNSSSGAEVVDALAAMSSQPKVLFTEPDMSFSGKHHGAPTDPLFDQSWALHNSGQFGGLPGFDLGALGAWQQTSGNPSVRVLVIDVGVQQDHPDILQLPGRDFTSGTSEGAPGGGPANPCDSHGTLVAGCISGKRGNQIGTCGIAPLCPVMSARCFTSNLPCDGYWTASYSWTANALNWGFANGCRVSNNSNGYFASSAAVAAAYAATRRGGMVHFASAGNSGANGSDYPASLPDVISVGAASANGSRPTWSNFGPTVDLLAPGDSVLTTDRTGPNGAVPGDFAVVSGTSVAAPFAAGSAALLLTYMPWLSEASVREVIFGTARDMYAPGNDTESGWGLVRPDAALLAIARDSGIVVAWGGNSSGQASVPTDLTGVTAIAASEWHTAALRLDGTIRCWGNNSAGQCNPPGDTDFSALAAGGFHTVALRRDGTVRCWGSNQYGQLTPPASLSISKSIGAGYEYSGALRNDRTVVCWGKNDAGQSAPPSTIGGVKQIALGFYHGMALRTNGTVACWGYNSDGQCNVPANLAGVTAIAAGAFHSVALRANGTVTAWGSNSALQSTVPIGLAAVTRIGAGGAHTLAVRADGLVEAWGWNGWGQASVPSGLQGVAAIAGGGYHSVALTCASGSSVQVSPNLGAFGADTPREYTFQGLDPVGTSGFVLATVEAIGNLLGPTEYLVVFLDGQQIGTVFQSVAVGHDCPTTPDKATLAVPLQQFSSAFADGAITVRVQASTDVATAQCASPFLRFQISLPRIGTDCDANGVEDTCQIRNDPGADCNENGVPDTCELFKPGVDTDFDGRLDDCERARCDLDLDGLVSGPDLSILLAIWGSSSPAFGDFNSDGVIGGADIAVLLGSWGPLSQ